MRNSFNNLEISIREFRAIKQANISLNGITVLAGVNSSGKSTVSKLVYYIISGMMDYDELVVRALRYKLRPHLSVLQNILLSSIDDFDTYSKYELKLNSRDDLFSLEERVSAACRYLKRKKAHPLSSVRYRRMLINTLNVSEDLSIEAGLNRLEEIIEKETQRAKDQIQRRPAFLLNEHVNNYFKDKVSEKVSIEEYGEQLFSASLNSVPIPHFVSRLFYIDTPFVLNNDFEAKYCKDLNEALKNQDHSVESSIASLIGRKVIKGDASYVEKESGSDYVFKDLYGNEFGLSSAATGIKSFAILQMLLRNGHIKEDTLLILDEPEAHLHPQWIAEYARVIVLIHKTLGTKFLISSHNPDMVGAIRYIAEAEGCIDKLSFYMASPSRDGKNRFSFRSTGKNIEPIFKSFNKSFEKVNKYAGGYEED